MKNITIDFLKSHIEVSDNIKNRINEVLLLIEEEDIYNDGVWSFDISNIDFDNNKEIIKVDIKEKGLYDIKERVIPYKYLIMEKKLLKAEILKLKEKVYETRLKMEEQYKEEIEKIEYKRYLELKEKFEKEKETCVICARPLDIYVSTNINLREHYVEGMGQLCDTCFGKYCN